VCVALGETYDDADGFRTGQEALRFAVPMLVWPMGAEQAASAAYLAQKLDVAFELLQTRDALAGRPLLSYPGVKIEATPDAVKAELADVLAQMFGAEGATKRAHIEDLSRKLVEEHEQRGDELLADVLAAC
jgi:hypothetical protein